MVSIAKAKEAQDAIDCAKRSMLIIINGELSEPIRKDADSILYQLHLLDTKLNAVKLTAGGI